MKRLVIVWACMLVTTLASALGVTDAVLTQEMLDGATKTFVVRKNYNLLGQTLVVPDGLSLSFVNGSMDNGELQGTNSSVEVLGRSPVFGLDLKISGTWNAPEVHDGWFAFDSTPEAVSNQVISNILAFSNDSTFCHIFFEEPRKYFFELPYNGPMNIGEKLSVRKVNGKYVRDYSDLDTEKHAYLRIFTIPSNTHVTITNSLKMLPAKHGAYYIFWEDGKENITIDGDGTIAGDNDRHIYESPFAGKEYYGEWGHIFRCVRCKNFTFKDITLSDAFGDCLIYSGSYVPDEPNTRWASGLTLDHVKILRARRNGVAIGARNVRIVDCYFEGCGTDEVKGTAPRSAIDFEPDGVKSYPAIGNRKVVMENCTFKNNYIDVASSVNNIPGYGVVATTIRNCQFTSRVKIITTYWIKFENCYIPFLYRKKGEDQCASKNISFVNCEFGEDRETVQSYFSKQTNKFTNCKFNTKKK